MLSSKKRYQLVAAFATLLLFASGVGCSGFFVDPTLTGITVGPTATIQTASTVQESAVGTYNDGSTKAITSGVNWTSGTPSIATVNKSGLVTGVSQGQSIITGASGTQTGTATITVTVGGLTAIKVTTQDGLTSIAFGSSEQFVATGTANGKQVDVTDSVTWTTNPSTITDISLETSTGALTTTNGGETVPVQFQVIATDPTTGINGTINFTVHP
jgi:Big-like domain-containing protein